MRDAPEFIGNRDSDTLTEMAPCFSAALGAAAWEKRRRRERQTSPLLVRRQVRMVAPVARDHKENHDGRKLYAGASRD
jgi:hypothetical protein